jgi:hypothetical protein
MTNKINKAFKMQESKKAKELIDLIESDKSFILGESLSVNPYLSYGLIPDNKIYSTIDDIKTSLSNLVDGQKYGTILFTRIVPSTKHINFNLPRKTWKVNESIDEEQIKESALVEIVQHDKLSEVPKLKFDIEVIDNDITPDKFLCIEKIFENKFRILKFFTFSQLVSKDRLKKLLLKSTQRPEAYNSIIENIIINNNKLDKTQLVIYNTKIDISVINSIMIAANDISKTFYIEFAKKNKEQKKIFDMFDSIPTLSTRIVKKMLEILGIDIVDSHLYYINDFQILYTNEFRNISISEVKNAVLTNKIFKYVTDKVHKFIITPNSNFIKSAVDLSILKQKH